jgi:hypothetical protein
MPNGLKGVKSRLNSEKHRYRFVQKLPSSILLYKKLNIEISSSSSSVALQPRVGPCPPLRVSWWYYDVGCQPHVDIEIYENIILLVVLYRCEIRYLTLMDEHTYIECVWLQSADILMLSSVCLPCVLFRWDLPSEINVRRSNFSMHTLYCAYLIHE